MPVLCNSLVTKGFMYSCTRHTPSTNFYEDTHLLGLVVHGGAAKGAHAARAPPAAAAGHAGARQGHCAHGAHRCRLQLCSCLRGAAVHRPAHLARQRGRLQLALRLRAACMERACTGKAPGPVWALQPGLRALLRGVTLRKAALCCRGSKCIARSSVACNLGHGLRRYAPLCLPPHCLPGRQKSWLPDAEASTGLPGLLVRWAQALPLPTTRWGAAGWPHPALGARDPACCRSRC